VDDLLVDAGESGRVHIDVPADLPPVRVDAVQLQRVVANLVDNALKYSSGQVDVHAHAEDGHVVVEVLDQGGAGVAPGAGIGLAIARGFAAVNGCEVTLEPRAGGGMRAAVTVPS
jgi:two-component system sensor histidine kinase KdpD